MNKYNKKITFSIILVFLFGFIICFTSYATYARYSSLSRGNSSVDIAIWNIKVNGTILTSESISEPSSFTSPILWEVNPYVQDNQIAPGSRGKSGIIIESTDTEVAFDYYIKTTIPTSLNNNINFGSLVAGTCDSSESGTLPNNETSCNSAGGIWNSGLCSAPEYLTETWCNTVYGAGKWTNISLTNGTGSYDGYKKGSMLLPSTTPMTNSNTIYAYVPVQWIDYNTDPENEDDTSTGILDSSASIKYDVIIEQKIE